MGPDGEPVCLAIKAVENLSYDALECVTDGAGSNICSTGQTLPAQMTRLFEMEW